MTTNSLKQKTSIRGNSVIQWLLDSDPSIRWQVMRDLTDAPDEDVTVERAKVAREARRAIARARGNVTWQGVLPQDAAWHGKPLFAGEVEPYIA